MQQYKNDHIIDSQPEVTTFEKLLEALEKEEMNEIDEKGHLSPSICPSLQHLVPRVQSKKKEQETENNDEFNLSDLYTQFSDKCQVVTESELETEIDTTGKTRFVNVDASVSESKDSCN